MNPWVTKLGVDAQTAIQSFLKIEPEHRPLVAIILKVKMAMERSGNYSWEDATKLGTELFARSGKLGFVYERALEVFISRGIFSIQGVDAACETVQTVMELFPLPNQD